MEENKLLSEKINIAIQVKGHIKFELFDAKTGALQKCVEGDNGVTQLGLDLIKLKILSALTIISGGLYPFSALDYGDINAELNPLTQGSSYFAAAQDIFKALVLTDNASVFDVNNALVEGVVTGFSMIGSVAAANSLDGSLNILESNLLGNVMTYVFDFPTDRGNGIHKSAYLVCDRLNSATIVALNTFPKRAFIATSRRSLPSINAGMSTSNSTIAVDDLYFYILTTAAPASLFKYSKETGVLISTVLLVGAINVSLTYNESVVYSGNMYSRYYNSNFYKINLTTGVISNLAYPTSASIVPMRKLGNYLYYVTDGTTMRRYNLSTETNDTAKTLPLTVDSASLYIQAGIIYLVSGNNQYIYDWVANTLTLYCNVPLTRNCEGWANSHPSYKTAGLTDDLGNAFFAREIQNCYMTSEATTATRLGIFIGKVDIAKKNQKAVTKQLLPAPVTKTNAQTMKVTYTLTFA